MTHITDKRLTQIATFFLYYAAHPTILMQVLVREKKPSLLWIHKIGVTLKLLWFISNNLPVVYMIERALLRTSHDQENKTSY